MTEVSPIAFFSQPDDTLEIATTTIGYPLEHVEVRYEATLIIVLLTEYLN